MTKKVRLKLKLSGGRSYPPYVSTKWYILNDSGEVMEDFRYRDSAFGVVPNSVCIPKGTKEEAFKRILNENKVKFNGLIGLKIDVEVSDKEASILRALAKKGGFKRKWEEVKDLPYDEFVDELFAWASVKEL